MRLIDTYKGLRKEFYILCIGTMMTSMGSMVFPMLTLILSKKLGLSATLIALWTMISGLVGLPLGLIGGKLADKYNKRNIIVFFDLISVIGYLYCGIVPLTIKSMIIFTLSSLIQSIERPSYDSLVADFTTPSDRERAYSLQYLGNNVGLILAPTISGMLLNNHLNIAFYINGFSILLSTILIFTLIKDVSIEKNDDDLNEYEKNLDEGISTISYLLSNRVLMLFTISSCLYFLVYQQYGYLMPLEMSKVFDELGSFLYGTVSSINCIVVVIFTSIITTYFKKVIDIDKQLIGSCLEIMGLLIFALLTKYIFACYVAIIIFTFGEIFSTISFPPFLSKRIPANHRGRINSIMSVAQSLTISVGSLFVGRLYDNSGLFAWIFVFIVGFISIGILLITKLLDRVDYKDLY